jgi:hypothetical protein
MIRAGDCPMIPVGHGCVGAWRVGAAEPMVSALLNRADTGSKPERDQDPASPEVMKG